MGCLASPRLASPATVSSLRRHVIQEFSTVALSDRPRRSALQLAASVRTVLFKYIVLESGIQIFTLNEMFR